MTPALHVVGADGNCGVPRRAVDRSATGVRYLVPLVMLAAALLAVVFVRVVRAPALGGLGIAQVVAGNATTGAGAMTRVLGPGWDATGRGVLRGSAATADDADVNAFETGVWAARFDVAGMIGDTIAGVQIAAHLRTVLANMAGVAPVLAQIERMARDDDGSSEGERAAVLDRLRTMSGNRRCFDKGVAVGKARMLAGQRGRGETEGSEGTAEPNASARANDTFRGCDGPQQE